MLGHFPGRMDPPAVDQHALPPPIRSPTSFPLLTISVARTGGGGPQGRAGRCRILRDGGGGGIRSGRRNRDRGGETRRESTAARRKIIATATTSARASKRNATEDLQVSSEISGGEYRVDGKDQEEISDESAE